MIVLPQVRVSLPPGSNDVRWHGCAGLKITDGQPPRESSILPGLTGWHGREVRWYQPAQRLVSCVELTGAVVTERRAYLQPHDAGSLAGA